MSFIVDPLIIENNNVFRTSIQADFNAYLQSMTFSTSFYFIILISDATDQSFYQITNHYYVDR